MTCLRRSLAWVLVLVGLALPAAARDVTRAVIDGTRLDEEIADACRRYCQGNRRRGRLRQVDLHPLGDELYRVRAEASLANLHIPDSGIGRGMQFGHTVVVVAHATLDARSCQLRLDRIVVQNDLYGLANLAKDAEGRVHTVEDCRRFL